MHHKPRREPRRKVLIRARLRAGGPAGEVCLLDVSSRGLLATCANPPGRGAIVEVLAEGRSLVGHVEWAGNRRFGVTLRERLDVETLLGGRGQPAVAPAAALLRADGHRAEAGRLIMRRLEFAVMAAAGFAGALTVCHAVAERLAVFHVVAQAMDQALPARLP